MTEPAASTDAIAKLIEPALAEMGYALVRVQFGGGHRPMLQIMAERRDEKPMGVEDCADISRLVSALLDVEDPIAGAYVLEVSSPGLDRPLTRLQHFERFAGHEARLETVEAHEGRRRFRGRLLGVEGSRVRMDTETGEIAIDFADIRKAKLVMTDALIGAAQPRLAPHQR